MINFLRNQHKTDIAKNLVQQWKKKCQAVEKKWNAKFSLKEKWLKNWTLEYSFKHTA